MKEAVVRFLAVMVGLVLFGIGVGAMFLAEFGVGPWDVLADALAKLLNRQPGTIIIASGVVLLGVVALLRQPIGPATVANIVVVGSTLNLVLTIMEPPSEIVARLALLVAAPIVVAFGSMLYLGGGLGIGIIDGLMMALVDVGLSIRVARTGLEFTVLIVGGALGGTYGVGTLVFALAVGPFLQYFRHRVWAGLPEPPRWVFRRT
jgi:uncharacterized membrane protein YczE